MSINSKVFNTEKTDYGNVSLFLGEQDMSLLDTVNRQFPEIWKLYKTMRSQDWAEDEFDFSTCNVEFKTCSKSQYDMMIKTLAWQWEADSIAARAIVPIIAPFITCSELFTAWGRVGDNECLTPDHEVLTPNGWKRIDEVTLDDKVAQWDYDTVSLSFVNPEEVIKKQYVGPMYHFHDRVRNVSQITTPNHRMPLVYPYWQGTKPWKHAEEIKYHGGNALPTSGFISSGRSMYFHERLWIAVQADGSLADDRYTGTKTGKMHYRFSFKRQDKIERLLWLCHMANWEVMEMDTKRANNDGVRSFIVYVPIEEYNERAKTFDWINLGEISYEWAKDFIDEIQYWDGNLTPNGRVRYTTTNKRCAEIAATIAHLVGMRGHITTIPERFNVPMPSGNSSNTKEGYQVYFSDRPYVVGNVINKGVVDYSGEVYCLRVPTSYFLVKHQGAISVTGNCIHANTYSEIVRCSFDNPNDVLDEVLSVKESLGRLNVISEVFAKSYVTSHKYALGMVENNQETYNDAFMFVVALLVLERIQFMSSFAVTFAICDTGLFQPIGKAIQKIAQDELEVHVQLDKIVLEHEMSTERGKIAFEQNKDLIKKMIDEVVNSEFEWVDYLFSEGRELVGLNADVLKKWVLFNSKEVYGLFGVEPEHTLPKSNPLKFMEKWLDISKTQPSPQEQDIGQYRMGIMRRDDSEESFDVDF